MSSSGTFTSTNASWRTAFLNSPGTPGSNFSYTTPVIPPGAYTVRVRAIDQHDFVSVIYERHATVTQPPNNPPGGQLHHLVRRRTAAPSTPAGRPTRTRRR